MLEITQATGVDISIFIILLSALLLYFGKVIGDTKVERYDKLEYYIEGLIFSAIYIYIPFFIAYYVKDIFRIPTLILLSIQVLILGCLSWNFIAHYLLRKYEFLDEFKRDVKQRINKIKEQDSFIGSSFRDREKWFKERFRLSYVGINVLIFYKIPLKVFGNKGCGTKIICTNPL